MKNHFILQFVFLFFISVFIGCNHDTAISASDIDENATIETRAASLPLMVTFNNNTTATYTGTSFIGEEQDGFRIVISSFNNLQTLTGIKQISIDDNNNFSISGSFGNYTNKTKLSAVTTSSGISVTIQPGNINFTTSTFIITDEHDGL